MSINPYETPNSKLTNHILTTNTRPAWKAAFWWLYFALMATMSITSVAMNHLYNAINLLFISSTLLDCCCIIGLYGYIKGKRILTDLFWTIIFILETGKIVLVTAAFFYNYITYTIDTNERLVALVGSFSFIVTIPIIYALWRYTFKTPSIWIRR